MRRSVRTLKERLMENCAPSVPMVLTPSAHNGVTRQQLGNIDCYSNGRTCQTIWQHEVLQLTQPLAA